MMVNEIAAGKCYRCFRPLKTCYCKYIVPVNTGVKFVFLMHPKEAYRQKTGTGRLAALSIIDAEIIIGIDFTYSKRLNMLIGGEGEYARYFPVVLFPSADAFYADTPYMANVLGEKKLLVIIVDATWFFAEKMLKLSTNLQKLPKLSFKNEYRSEFSIKVQPAPACLSTIESSYHLIEELKGTGIINRTVDQSALLSVFRKMVEYQQYCMRTHGAPRWVEKKHGMSQSYRL